MQMWFHVYTRVGVLFDTLEFSCDPYSLPQPTTKYHIRSSTNNKEINSIFVYIFTYFNISLIRFKNRKPTETSVKTDGEHQFVVCTDKLY